jgi:prepilin-type N-terminal cleavage/methylation domain-containing protein
MLKRGYTLLEVVVVVAIIAILTAVIAVNVVDSGRQSRDAKRQADLRTLQTAIELYKNKYGRYPEQCNVAVPAAADGWSGQQGTSYACAGGDTQYIVGHVDVSDFDGDGNVTERFSFAPEFIPVLPKDPKLNGAASGYIYRTNAAGTIFKLKAQRTVEASITEYTHPLKPCDIRVGSDPSTGSLLSGATNRETIGWCGRVYPTNSLPNSCRYTDDQWRRSYGVWGGFEAKRTAPVDVCGAQVNCVPSVVQDTTNVICK